MTTKVKVSHTPGGWGASRWQEGAGGSIPMVMAGGIPICKMHVCPATKELEREANARLIAAAPELLEALKLATAYVEKTHGVVSGTVGHNNIVLPDLEKCQAAIRKVECNG